MPDVRRWVRASGLPRGWAWAFAMSGVGFLAAPVESQSLDDRIEAMRLKRAQAARAVQPAEHAGPSIDALLAARVNFAVRDVGFRESLQRWSTMTGVPLLINWDAMANDGVDPGVPVSITLEDLPAAQVLLILMDVGSTDFRFIAEVETWGVQIRTRSQANRDVQVRVYDVSDLTVNIPSFDDAPGFELSDVLEGSGSGSGGGGGPGLFDQDQSDTREEPTKQENGDKLAETIRQTVEPDVWIENGGEFSTLRYVNGRLIVRAPAYVHSQIAGSAVVGAPDAPTGYRFRSRRPVARSGPVTDGQAREGVERASGNNVASVAEHPQDVADVAE